jgi:hypothetical protein
LTISGKVLHFAKLEPKYARLIGHVGTEIKQTITITREKDYPFSVVKAKARNGKEITIDVKEFKKENSDGYILTIENKKSVPGRYSDTLVLTTDSKVKPTLTIPVYGRIMSEELQQSQPKPPKTGTNEG